MPSKVFEKQVVFHPVMEEQRSTMPLMEVIQRVQRHILENRIRISEFFKVILKQKSNKKVKEQHLRLIIINRTSIL